MPPSPLDAALRALAAVLRANYERPKLRLLALQANKRILRAALAGAPVAADALYELLPFLYDNEAGEAAAVCALHAMEPAVLGAGPADGRACARAMVLVGDPQLVSALAGCLRSSHITVAAAAARLAALLATHRPAARALAAGEPWLLALDALARLMLLAAPRAASQLLPAELGRGQFQSARVGEHAGALELAQHALGCVVDVLKAHTPTEQVLLWGRLELLPVALAAQLYSEHKGVAHAALAALPTALVAYSADDNLAACAPQNLYSCVLLVWRCAEEELLLLRDPPRRPGGGGLSVWVNLLGTCAQALCYAALFEYRTVLDGRDALAGTASGKRRRRPQLHWGDALEALALHAPWPALYRAFSARAHVHAEMHAHAAASTAFARQLGLLLQQARRAADGPGGCAARALMPRADLELELARLKDEAAPGALARHQTFVSMMRGCAERCEYLLDALDRLRQRCAAPKPPRMCAACGRTKAGGAASLRLCRGCGEATGVRYCSVGCARAHWKRMRHKQECEAAQEVLRKRRAYEGSWDDECRAANAAALGSLRARVH